MRRDRVRIYGTRPALAEATGLAASTLSELERGVRGNFHDDTLGRVEDALGWAPGAIRDLAGGKRARRVADEHLARLHEAWPRLSVDARAILAELAERGAAERR